MKVLLRVWPGFETSINVETLTPRVLTPMMPATRWDPDKVTRPSLLTATWKLTTEEVEGVPVYVLEHLSTTHTSHVRQALRLAHSYLTTGEAPVGEETLTKEELIETMQDALEWR